MHGLSARRRHTDTRRRLEEKQKVRFHYGVSERQLRRFFTDAGRQPGATGAIALTRLERRLDNVVFRLGLAPTIPAARQLVGHGHVRVNGARVNRPGFLVDAGQAISVSARARRLPAVADAVARGPEVRLPAFLEPDAADPFTGRVVGRPSRHDVPFQVDEQAIVELYAR